MIDNNFLITIILNYKQFYLCKYSIIGRQRSKNNKYRNNNICTTGIFFLLFKLSAQTPFFGRIVIYF
jgi:hypothetical protein